MRWRVGIGLLIGLLIIAVPQQASAGFLDCVFNATACAAQGIVTIFAGIAAVAIHIIAYFGKMALELSFNIVNNPAVQKGFSITLSVTNLGFVVGIIAIAIATILRNQTFGMRKLLVKLVVMAILVNFSLILSGMIINFSDSMTNYVMTSMGDVDIFDTIMAAAKPQVFSDSYIKPDSIFAKEADQFMQSIISVGFGAAFSFLMVLAFGVLTITLFLRYVILTILLIVMPLAWLCWVVPTFSKYWNDWWDKFIKWTFYAPVLVFFIYLAALVGTSDTYVPDSIKRVPPSEMVNGYLGESKNSDGTPFVQQAVRSTLVIFIMMAGFVAANKMGIAMAGAAHKTAYSAKDWAVKRSKTGARNVARRTGARVLASEPVTKLQQRMQTVGAKNKAWNILGAGLIRKAGQGIEGVQKSTTSVVDDYKKNLSGLDKDQLKLRIQSMRGAELVAAMEVAKDKGVLGDVAKTMMPYANEGLFKKYGKDKVLNAAKDLSGMSFEEYATLRAAGDATKAAEAAKKSGDAIKGMSADDIKSFFTAKNQNPEVLKEIIRGLAAQGTYGKLNQIMDGLNADEASKFTQLAKEANITEANLNAKLKKDLNSGKAQGLFTLEDLGIKKPPPPPEPEKPPAPPPPPPKRSAMDEFERNFKPTEPTGIRPK